MDHLYRIWYKSKDKALPIFVFGYCPEQAQKKFKKEHPRSQIVKCESLGKGGIKTTKIYVKD